MLDRLSATVAMFLDIEAGCRRLKLAGESLDETGKAKLPSLANCPVTAAVAAAEQRRLLDLKVKVWRTALC